MQKKSTVPGWYTLTREWGIDPLTYADIMGMHWLTIKLRFNPDLVLFKQPPRVNDCEDLLSGIFVFILVYNEHDKREREYETNFMVMYRRLQN